ncbi:hypothetical protein [Agromyces seonyuensis]|uniref:Uncharacterized protein n=1 Tax=Agromyces seonyuensis TaxID=2662446 RepID=A0A6I4P0H3_9MICO|nr:hypothetical protein [Agromyces seonyuensis]MWC00037.1 hypothetical protein [Agromyces seonyuensis]
MEAVINVLLLILVLVLIVGVVVGIFFAGLAIERRREQRRPGGPRKGNGGHVSSYDLASNVTLGTTDSGSGND